MRRAVFFEPVVIRNAPAPIYSSLDRVVDVSCKISHKVPEGMLRQEEGLCPEFSFDVLVDHGM